MTVTLQQTRMGGNPEMGVLRKTGTTSVPRATYTQIPYDTTDLMPTEMGSQTNLPGRIRAPTAGFYLIIAQISFATAGVADADRHMMIYKITAASGYSVGVGLGGQSQRRSGAFQTQIPVVAVANLAAGDDVAVAAWYDDGSTATLTVQNYLRCTKFAMIKLPLAGLGTRPADVGAGLYAEMPLVPGGTVSISAATAHITVDTNGNVTNDLFVNQGSGIFKTVTPGWYLLGGTLLWNSSSAFTGDRNLKIWTGPSGSVTASVCAEWAIGRTDASAGGPYTHRQSAMGVEFLNTNDLVFLEAGTNENAQLYQYDPTYSLISAAKLSAVFLRP